MAFLIKVLALVYHIRSDGNTRGPLSFDETVDRIRSGEVEPWHEIAEVDLGIKPSSNRFAPANTTALWRYHGTARDEYQQRLEEEREALERIMLTTEVASGLEIGERLGIVTAECAYGMNIFRDLFAAVRDTTGGRSRATQNVLRDAKEEALAELRRQAFELDADAVVAVDLDYTEFSGGGKSMLVCVASGTAVKLKPPEQPL